MTEEDQKLFDDTSNKLYTEYKLFQEGKPSLHWEPHADTTEDMTEDIIISSSSESNQSDPTDVKSNKRPLKDRLKFVQYPEEFTKLRSIAEVLYPQHFKSDWRIKFERNQSASRKRTKSYQPEHAKAVKRQRRWTREPITALKSK